MTNDEPSDSVYEMAEQAWSECWPEEPSSTLGRGHDPKYKSKYRAWLIGVFTRLVEGYEGKASDLTEILEDFQDQWISKKAEAILDDAREAEAQARADSREGW